MSDSPPSSLAPGTLLGRYRLVERVGAGGMGEVYRAVDTALEREVAVKVLPPSTVETPDRRRRFTTEAKSAATVSHPNLVAVFDVGEAAGVPYIVQELIRGETVSQILAREGPLPVTRLALWGAQAAEGLAKAHEAGILHRDVKPGNLIVDRDGRLRILDFGLAKVLGRSLADAQTETEAGLVVGSVHYMSPEQAMGRELDPRSDAFALGIVLYEMATGVRPFHRDSAVETMHAIAYEPCRPILPEDPPLPQDLVAILRKALEKRLEDRYQTLREMAADLWRLHQRSSGESGHALRASDASGRPVAPAPGGRSARGAPSPGEPTVALATPPAAVPGTGRAGRRRLLAGVGLSIAALAAAAFFASRRLPAPQTPRATRFLVQTDSSEEGPVFAPDGRSFVYASNERGDYDLYTRLVAGGSPVRLTSTPDDERDPCFTPDGATVFYSKGDVPARTTAVFAVPALGGAPRRVVESGDQPAVSPDGSRLLYRRWEGARTVLEVSALDGASPRRLFAPEQGEVLGARFSPDGRSIAFLWREAYPGALGDLYLMPAEGGAPDRLTRDRKDVWGHVEWLPRGGGILYAAVRTGGASIWMVPARGGDPRPVTGGGGWLISPSLSPDGSSLLVQTQRDLSDAWELSLKDGTLSPLTRAGTVWAPIRLPDGRLVYGDWARQEEELELYLEDARIDPPSRTLLGRGSNPRASADGRRIYVSSEVGEGRRALFAVEVEGGPARKLTEPAGQDEYPDPTPDGLRLVFCRSLPTGRGGLALLSLAGGEAPVQLLFEGDAMSSRAGAGAAVFHTCTPPEGCGVYAVPYGGGAPRLLVREGRWPALSPDRDTVYALTGPKARPVLVRTPLAGGPVETVHELNPRRDPRFWAVFTMDVAGGAVVLTHQRNDDDVVVLEGIFR